MMLRYGIGISRFGQAENRQDRFGKLSFFKMLFLWDKFHKSSLLVIPIKILGGFTTYPTIFREPHESKDPIIPQRIAHFADFGPVREIGLSFLCQDLPADRK
jgi:hypothetical protein